MKSAQIQLFNQMLTVFNEDELIELTFLLNINYEDLNGKNRRAKAVSLVDYCKRADRLDALISLCQERRPAVSWPSVTEQESDRYDIQEELGTGAFATVYKALDRKLDRIVAIKILHEHLRWDPDNVQRFHNEASSASKLNHPGIVTIYDRGEMNGRFYITMRYIEGQTLRQHLEDNVPLAQSDAIRILQPIAEALDYAHSQGVVHRDIKPNNIMIEQSGVRLKLTLLDFGLVKAMSDTVDITSLGVTLGTPEYMSPEQADPERRDEIGPASDRYALGIVAYQMLTGRVPFEGNTTATLYAHEYKPVPPPQELRPDLPNYVADALVKMLAKDSAARFRTAAEFVQVLHPMPQLSQQTTQTAVPTMAPPIGVPNWGWIVASVALVLFVVLAVWRPWISLPEEAASTTEPTELLAEKEAETAVSPAPRSVDGSIGINQTLSGKISGAEAETWLYTGPDQQVDIIVDGLANDSFALILYHPDGREAAYVDYSGKGQGELLTYFDIEENTQIVVDEIENDGAEYTLTISESELDFIWPGKGYSGSLRGANPELFVFDEGPAVVDLVLEMSDKDLPLLIVFRPDGSQLAVADQADENNRITIENLEFSEGEYQLMIRDQANDGADYRFEMREIVDAETAVPTDTVVINEIEDVSQEIVPSQTIYITETGDTIIRPKDDMEMIYISGDTFMMGANSQNDPDSKVIERPAHQVQLDEFWIDKFEVSNEQFDRFIDQTGYKTSAEKYGYSYVYDVNIGDNGAYQSIEGLNWRSPSEDVENFGQHPVIHVSWEDARAYCEWINGALPTEAQWEYAAKGKNGNIYPWGNTFFGENANFCDENCEDFDHKDDVYDDGYSLTSPVDSFEEGASWAGVMNMAGNVWEWVYDWHGEYSSEDKINPTGNITGTKKVTRGGGWASHPGWIRTTNRWSSGSDFSYYETGFRCVVPVENLPKVLALLPVNLSSIENQTRTADNMRMVLVPHGTFQMGALPDDPDAQEDEFPQHDVTLAAFWLDKTEVSNEQFAAFLNEEGNLIEEEIPWLDLDSPRVGIVADNGRFRSLEGFADHPVVAVSWFGASAYCQWVESRLPTEAEWEYAAKGPDNNLYPWGNEAPTSSCTLAHYRGCSVEMTPVGSHPEGDSWIGASDMAGNAQEWVADWYGTYPDEPRDNPNGAERGTQRVQRGGARPSNSFQIRTTARAAADPTDAGTTNGFRCVMPVE